jgi:hypothetical protein
MIPDQVSSRVDSYDWLISLVVMPAGFAIVGPLAARAGGYSAACPGSDFIVAVHSASISRTSAWAARIAWAWAVISPSTGGQLANPQGLYETARVRLLV